MPEPNQNPPATVPEQMEPKPPLRKSMPVVIALVAIVALIGIANVSSLVRGNKRSAPASALPMRPATASPQQVSSFQSQQQMQARRDAEERQHQQVLAAAMQQLQAAESATSTCTTAMHPQCFEHDVRAAVAAPASGAACSRERAASPAAAAGYPAGAHTAALPDASRILC
jgi:hypothetical protein